MGTAQRNDHSRWLRLPGYLQTFWRPVCTFHKRAFSFGAVVKLAADGLIYGPHTRCAVDSEPNHDSELRPSCNELLRAVHGVDEPNARFFKSDCIVGCFFGNNTVFRIAS